MAKLTVKEVEHIARLANLSLTPQENELLANQLSATLDYVAKLEEVNTEGVSSTFQTTGLMNVTREDEVKPSLTQEQALSNARSTYGGYFKVQAVLEE